MDPSWRATVPGLLVLPTVDDGSAPDPLLVVRGDDPARPQRIAGVDPRTGTTRWTVTTPAGRAAVVQGLLPDGTVVAVGSGELVGLRPPGR